jgi:hypothetical protein
LRTGSAIGASAVENIGVLGIGFKPNRHNKEICKKTRKGQQMQC